MRGLNLTVINGSLYEIVRSVPSERLKNQELTSDDIALLKLWTDADHIFKNTHTNHYILVKKVEELEIE